MYIEVSTQSFVNKSDTATPYWSPKGERVFNLEVDRDNELDVMYNDRLGESIEAVVASHNDELHKFEVLEWTVRFVDPIKDKLVLKPYAGASK